MTDKWISPVDKARVPNNLLDRADQLESIVKQLQQKPLQLRDLASASGDPWGVNISLPNLAGGRLAADGNQKLAFSPGRGGNLCSLYDGSIWRPYVIQPLATWVPSLTTIGIGQSFTGTTVNGSPIVALVGLNIDPQSPPDTSQLIAGMTVLDSGARFPAGTTILTVDSLTQVTLSANATSSATNGIQFNIPADTDLDVFGMDSGTGEFALRFVMWTARFSLGITGATNVSPIAITSNGHGLATGDIVDIFGVLGNTAANGTRRITVTGANTFTLQTLAGANVAGSGAYTAATGTWRKINQTATRNAQLALQDGVYVKNTDATWRYLGSAHVGPTGGGTDDKGTTGDSDNAVWVWSYYNRVRKLLRIADATASWTVTTAAGWQVDHNDMTNRVEFIIGATEDIVNVNKRVTAQPAAAANSQAQSGLSLDAVGTPTFFNSILNSNIAAIRAPISNAYCGQPSNGYHWVFGMEKAVTNSANFIGAGEHVLEGEIWA